MPRYEPIPLPDRKVVPQDQMREQAVAFYDNVRRRHTIRAFSPAPVPRDIIETCIRAAGTAPSGANHQPWHFVCISDPNVKYEIRLAAEREEKAFYGERASAEWLEQLAPLGTDENKEYLEIAPWLIAIFAERYGIDEDGESFKHYYVPESVGIATGLLINALHTSGLATLTHTPNPMRFLSKILARPKNERPFLLLVAGYPAENATIPFAATIKKPLDAIATFVEPD